MFHIHCDDTAQLTTCLSCFYLPFCQPIPLTFLILITHALLCSLWERSSFQNCDVKLSTPISTVCIKANRNKHPQKFNLSHLPCMKWRLQFRANIHRTNLQSVCTIHKQWILQPKVKFFFWTESDYLNVVAYIDWI